MKLVLLDSLSLPGDPAKANDDSFGCRDTAAVVLDGATGLGDSLMPGPSDAAWLSRFGANRILSYVGDGASGRDAVVAALFDTENSFTQLRRRAPVERYEIPYASLMLAVPGEFDVDFLWYGDCAAVMLSPGEPAEIVGEALARRAREGRYARKLAQGGAVAGAGVRETYLPALRAARNTVNTRPGAYLFGPDVEAADHLSEELRQAQPGTLILLATDGFLALTSDYGCYDLDGLVGAAQAKGLAALGAELRAFEDEDPEGRTFPRFKKSDDATAVLVRVE